MPQIPCRYCGVPQWSIKLHEETCRARNSTVTAPEVVSQRTVTPDSTVTDVPSRTVTDMPRNRRWEASHAEQYRTWRRGYMRQYRAR